MSPNCRITELEIPLPIITRKRTKFRYTHTKAHANIWFVFTDVNDIIWVWKYFCFCTVFAYLCCSAESNTSIITTKSYGYRKQLFCEYQKFVLNFRKQTVKYEIKCVLRKQQNHFISWNFVKFKSRPIQMDFEHNEINKNWTASYANTVRCTDLTVFR